MRAHLPSPSVVLVTGASSGIGRATALRWAREGHHLALVARDTASLADTAAECDAVGAASTMTPAADVGDDAEVAACVEKVLAEHGRLDVVVSAAGVVAYGRTEEVPVDVFDAVLRTNLVGSVNLTRHVLPVLRRQGSGALVYVGSVVGHVAVPTMAPYVISKWGLRALARHVELENRDLPGVRVRYVAPGAVDTPIYHQAANYGGRAARPPAPLASAAKVADQVARRVGRFPLPAQLSLANHGLTTLFAHLPAVYDRVIGPAFSMLAQDGSTPVPATTGNVLAPRPERHRVVGGYPPAWAVIGRNLRSLAR